jgi:peptide/nickel transport system substrate-binding protein
VRVDRRSFLQLGASALGAAAMGGAIDLAALSSSAGAASKPKLGGHLRVGLLAEVNGLNPLSSSLATSGTYYGRAIFDPLAIVASDGTVKPYLCRSITPNKAYTAWTFKLRPGIKFHDGTPLDSTALVNQFQHLLHSPFSVVSAFSTVTAIQPVDSLTVSLQLSAPWIALPAYLTGTVGPGQLGFVAAPSMLANPKGAMQPVGTGPFIFESWEPGSHLVVKRNPNYWQKGLPYLSQITFTPIVDDTSRYQSLQAGTLDLIQTSAPLIVSEMVNNSSINVLDNIKAPPIEPSQSFIMLNTKQPPLDDIRVRRALAFATDQKRVIAVTGGGLGVPSTGLFPPGNKFYAPTGYPGFNLKKAKALIAEYRAANGGKAPGFPIQVDGTTYLDTAQQLQQMWKLAGIDVTIDTVEQATGLTHTLQGQFSAATQQQYEAADPDQNYSYWSSKTNAPLGTVAVNFARFSNPTIDAALETGRSDPDPAARIKAYQTISDQFAKYVPYVWINRQIWAIGTAKNVQGVDKVAIPTGGFALPLTQGDVWLQRIWIS